RTTDAGLLEQARSAKNIRVQANLYRAIFSSGSYPPALVEEVKQKYLASKDDYQKAMWLGSLSAAINSYHLIFDELLHSPVLLIQSSAAQALTDINHNKNFPTSLKSEMAGMYRQAIGRGDPA